MMAACATPAPGFYDGTGDNGMRGMPKRTLTLCGQPFIQGREDILQKARLSASPLKAAPPEGCSPDPR